MTRSRRVPFRVVVWILAFMLMSPALRAADIVWMEDDHPTGAFPNPDTDGWNYVTNPLFSGAKAHQSSLLAGIHQHYFSGATATLPVAAGEKLFCYVYLDPVNPPAQVMVQWNDGWSWEHRAYWGASLIPWGTENTMSRQYIGALPPAGQWYRLEVEASLLGLEEQTLNGMAFTLFNGRATWDRAGKVTVPPPSTTATMRILAHPPGSRNENFRIQGTGFSVSYVPVPDAFHVYGTAGYQHLRWNSNQTQLENLYMGTAHWPDLATIYGRSDCAHTKDPRLWDARCGDAIGYFWKRVSCPGGSTTACQDNDRWNGAPGLFNLTPFATPGIWPRTDDFGSPGYTPLIDFTTINRVPLQPADNSKCSKAAGDMIWFADVLPNNAVMDSSTPWPWVDTASATGTNVPFAGRSSHQSGPAWSIHQRFFTNSTSPLIPSQGDMLTAYVYLDPNNPPREIMLQWFDGTWEHRAFWGANRINWGVNGTASRRYIDVLPTAGQWARLEVPANQVGLVGRQITGMAFTLFDGHAYWDHAGKRTPAAQTLCPPKTGRTPLTTFHAYNPDDFATGTANAKVVQYRYADGSTRWFMAFNAMIHYVSVTYGLPKRNDSDYGKSAADNWRVLWATSPDGITWTVDPQILFRSNTERDSHFKGLLVTDMIVEGGYFYLLFQDLMKPYSYLARSPIRVPNSTSHPGYDSAGWSIACNPITVSGQYTWKAIPPTDSNPAAPALGRQIDFAALNAAQIMPTRLFPTGETVKQASMARVFKTAASNSESRIFAVTSDFSQVQLWSTTDLTRPFVYESDVTLDPSITLGANGWEFGFTHYIDNMLPTPRLIGPSLQVWVAEQAWAPNGTNFVLLTRRNAEISGF